MRLFRPIDTPARQGLTTQEAWLQEDDGLIACWERGREYAGEHPDLAAAAKAGELVPLPWKGGVERETKIKRKFGSFRYLAMWHGLRGDDLNIDTDRELPVICSRYAVTVTFTPDDTKYANAGQDAE